MERRGRRFVVALAGAMALALAGSAPASASPYIHAHRGGPIATEPGGRQPAQPEASLGAYAAAAEAGFVLEADVKLTSDRVPIVIHDASLDRTTDCEGEVAAMTFAELRAGCEIDLLGASGATEQLPEGDPRRESVPSLEELLLLAARTRSEVNLEIKNVPTDPDFDPGAAPDFAKDVAKSIKTSGFPPGSLMVQSFWPPNLDVIAADPYFELAETSYLSLEQANEGAPAVADSKGYDWVSPAWPVSREFVSEAHALGLMVVPYTIDDRSELREATRLGVDAVISNDPGLAREAVRAEELPKPEVPEPPSRRECLAASADRLEPPIESFDEQPGAPRVHAIQFKQDLRHVVTYEDFRIKIECMVREYVRPRLADGRPNVVALNEDIGLMTLATGSRGAAAREIFTDPDAPNCEGQPVPCGVAAAITALQGGYAAQADAYQSRYPEMGALAGTFVAGTDTFGRGWMQVFSDMAKRYGVYILGSNNQAPFRESRDPAEIDAFADPDLPRPDSVFVATRPTPYNEVFMWGPQNVRKEGPRVLRNVVAQNKKVPVTPIEELIEVEPGPSTGPDAIENLRPYRIPGTKAKVSFATSKPAFEYGHDLGDPPPAGDPCADVSVTYMRCLDRLGTNVVMQDEANPGRWTGPSGEGNWTPLEWMRSTWRAVGDPDVSFDYNVTPHMVGNLADLPFDGQTAITQRDLAGASSAVGRGCTYVGDTRFMPGPPENDPAYLQPYAGNKREFLGIVPWVRPDGPREALRDTGAALAPGSGDELENDYVESALIADLPFPVNPDRPRCGNGSVQISGACANLRAGTFRADTLRGRGRGDLIKGLGGGDLLKGRKGRDCLIGAQGEDRLRGSRGADKAGGGRGSDGVRGGKGRDRVKGGPGDDEVSGGGGRDRVVGGKGSDRLRGSRGRDRLLARDGEHDLVRCGLGRDVAKVDRLDRVHRSCERVRRG